MPLSVKKTIRAHISLGFLWLFHPEDNRDLNHTAVKRVYIFSTGQPVIVTRSIYTSLALLCHKKHSGTTKQLSSGHRMWHKPVIHNIFFCSFWHWWEWKDSYSARKTTSMEYPGMVCVWQDLRPPVLLRSLWKAFSTAKWCVICWDQYQQLVL